MSVGYQKVLAATFTLAALVGWTATSTGETAQADPLGELIRATACATSAYHVATGENATMTVANDGGWCWADTYQRRNWRTLSAHSVAMTNPSRHGHVLVGDIENQEVRIAYQPDSGFAGRDSFTIRYDTDGSERTFLITVTK